MPDFRSDPMPTNEGRGKARRAWDAYARSVNRVALPTIMPLLNPTIERMAAKWTTDLIGFWVVWHLQGGFEGMQRLGYNEATIYRKIARFRRLFGKHPDEFTMAGVKIDPLSYWDTYLPSKRPKGKK